MLRRPFDLLHLVKALGFVVLGKSYCISHVLALSFVHVWRSLRSSEDITKALLKLPI